MPRLWSDTIESHRRDVRTAILDTTATLVTERGVRGVTMSQIAEAVGIGRATLYKYFASVEAILEAWHAATVSRHLEALASLAGGDGEPLVRLHAVLEALATIERHRQVSELSRVITHGPAVAADRQRLLALVEVLVTEGVTSGEVRADVPAGELAAFCVHAVGASADVTSSAGLRRLVTVTIEAVTPR